MPKAKSTPTTPEAAAPAAATPTTPKAAKAVKVNPSQSYIGFTITGKDEQTVNYRQGKNNVVTCTSVRCTAANATGRRLDVAFLDGKGTVVLERRVYKEYFEKMAQKFGVELPE